MEKKVTSNAESYCLLIKRIGKHQILENTPKGHTNSSKMFSQNAMCQWVKLCFYSLNQISLNFFNFCWFKVVRLQGHEADDVVATLMEQAVQRGYRAVIASPDKDFKQLISENVQIVIPLSDLRRWSFYTLKHYLAQYNCDPQSDLSFRKCLHYLVKY